MYNNVITFTIVSKSHEIESALRMVTPEEDSEYIFKTVEDISQTEKKSLDCALIIDCTETDQPITDCSGARTAAIFKIGNIGVLSADTVSAVDDIWLMPESGVDQTLLKTYFAKLSADMKKAADNRRQYICFNTLINSVPDVLWYKDTEGRHLIVNDSFCSMVGKSKQQIYKRGHCYIWDASKEDEEVCLDSDRQIMESRRTNSFEEVVKTKTDMKLLKSYKSPLIDEDGSIFGTCGIASDLTEFRNESTGFNDIFDTLPFALLIENNEGVVINKNQQFDNYFPEFFNIIGKSSDEWLETLTIQDMPGESFKEVYLHYGNHNLVLMMEEKSMEDIFHRSFGKVITLTDITKEHRILKINEYRANTDYLTELHNRLSFDQYFKAIDLQNHISLVWLDLDNFKQINDTMGHDAGDRALVKAAQLMRDSFKDDFIARMGGDEFAIITANQTEDEVVSKADSLIEKMKAASREVSELKGVTVSIGILNVDRLDDEIKSNLKTLKYIVDEQLYCAKNSGKGRHCVYGRN